MVQLCCLLFDVWQISFRIFKDMIHDSWIEPGHRPKCYWVTYQFLGRRSKGVYPLRTTLFSNVDPRPRTSTQSTLVLCDYGRTISYPSTSSGKRKEPSVASSRLPHVAMVTAILVPHTHPHIARPLSAAVIHASRPPRKPRSSGQNSEANLRLQAKPSINPAAPSGRLDHLRASSPIHRSRCSSKKSIFNWMNRGRGRRRG